MGAPTSAHHTDTGKALSLGAAAPVNGRRWRLAGTQTGDLRLLKTLKKPTVASPLVAIWRTSDKTAFGEGPIKWN